MTTTNKPVTIKVKDRKENGIELRKTHFLLGTDGIFYINFQETSLILNTVVTFLHIHLI